MTDATLASPATAAPAAPAAVAAPAAPAAAPASTAAVAAAAVAAPPAASPASAPAPEAPVALKAEDFKLPEGVKIDPELMLEFTGLATELKLDTKNAQRAVDLGSKIATKLAAKQQADFQATKSAWEQQSKADKEFGGDKLAENLAVAGKAMEKFATPEFRTFLKESGLGDHPEMIRAFVRAGKLLSEDNKVVQGTGLAHTPDNSAAAKLYPSQPVK